MYIPTVDGTKKTASKQLRRGDPDLGLEKVASLNLSLSSPTSCESSVTDSSHESVTSFSILELVQAGCFSEGCLRYPLP